MLRRVRSGLHLGAGLRCANMRRPPSVKSGSVRPYYLKKAADEVCRFGAVPGHAKSRPTTKRQEKKFFASFFQKRRPSFLNKFDLA
jgi:hypothetical protein